MKIAINTRSLIPNKLDGIGWFTYQVSKRLAERHPEIEFLFIFDRPFSPEFIFTQNVRPVVLFPPARHPFLYIWFYQFSLKKLLEKEKPDIFIATDGMISLGSNCKQLAVIHDINFLHFPSDLKFFYRKYYNLFMPKFAKKATRIATVSEFSKQDISNNYGVQVSKIDVVYNGINDGFKVLNELAKNEVQGKYSLGAPYFLFVGSLSPRKNLVRLVQAFEQFKNEKETNYKLLVAGGNFWGEEKLEALLKTCKHANDIIFTGRLSQEELCYVTGSAFALVFASYFEGFGIPLVEAMECGVPILCSNTSCMSEIAGEAALYFDPFDVSDMAEKMSMVANNQHISKELILAGNQQKAQFSWENTTDKLWDSILKTL